MIALVLAAALSAGRPELAPGTVQEQSLLSIDPCVGADAEVVEPLLDLEIGPGQAPPPSRPNAIEVRCVDGGQEIRVEPWASLGLDGVRTIQLPPVDSFDTAAREGRSRELALAIAELIRRLQAIHPMAPPAPPPPPPAPVVAVLEPPPPAAPSPGRWQLGLLSTAEFFGGGQRMIGADVTFAASLGHWLGLELRGGGRQNPDDQTSKVARTSERAAVGSVATGLLVQRRAVGFGLLLRAEGFLVQLRVAPLDGGAAQTALRGAVALAGEPRVSLRVARHVWLLGAAGAGACLHGIVVRTQGGEIWSMSGVLVSASLGAVVTF